MSKIPPISFEGINFGLSWAILTGKAPSYLYSEDGKRQSDIPEKWRYTIALPGNCYNPLTVSIEGSVDSLANVRDEDIANACASLQPILVSFTNCTVKVYTVNREQKMSATASGVELVKASK